MLSLYFIFKNLPPLRKLSLCHEVFFAEGIRKTLFPSPLSALAPALALALVCTSQLLHSRVCAFPLAQNIPASTLFTWLAVNLRGALFLFRRT